MHGTCPQKIDLHLHQSSKNWNISKISLSNNEFSPIIHRIVQAGNATKKLESLSLVITTISSFFKIIVLYEPTSVRDHFFSPTRMVHLYPILQWRVRYQPHSKWKTMMLSNHSDLGSTRTLPCIGVSSSKFLLFNFTILRGCCSRFPFTCIFILWNALLGIRVCILFAATRPYMVLLFLCCLLYESLKKLKG